MAIGRRGVLKGAAVFAAATILASKMKGSRGPEAEPMVSSEPIGIGETVTEEELRAVATTVAVKYKQVLGSSLDVDSLVKKVFLIPTREEFESRLLEENPDYAQEEGMGLMAISEEKTGNIFINQKELESVLLDFSQLPTRQDANLGRLDFLTFILSHEFVHTVATPYQSPELHETVYEQFFANHGVIQLEPGIVKGARISAYKVAERKQPVAFQDVEEAEAELISRIVYDELFAVLFEPPDSYVPEANQALRELISAIASRTNSSCAGVLTHLSRLREKVGGREEWFYLLAKTFEVEKDQLLFGVRIMHAIEEGDLYLLMGLLNHTISSEDRMAFAKERVELTDPNTLFSRLKPRTRFLRV